MITVKAFCEQTGMKSKTVYKRLEKNKNGVLDGHIFKESGAPYMLDEFAAEFLKSDKILLAERTAELNKAQDECREVIAKKEEILHKAVSLEVKNESLTEELSSKSNEYETSNKELSDRLRRAESEIASCNNSLFRCQAELEKSRADVLERDNIIAEIRAEAENERSLFKTVLEDKDKIIAELTANSEKERTVFKIILEDKNNIIADKDKRITELETEIQKSKRRPLFG